MTSDPITCCVCEKPANPAIIVGAHYYHRECIPRTAEALLFARAARSVELLKRVRDLATGHDNGIRTAQVGPNLLAEIDAAIGELDGA